MIMNVPSEGFILKKLFGSKQVNKRPLNKIAKIGYGQPVFDLSPQCCVLIGEATNTNFIVFGLTRPGLEPTIYCTRGEHTNHYI
jgi:hypothetical protein